jgi:hypothetical protein
LLLGDSRVENVAEAELELFSLLHLEPVLILVGRGKHDRCCPVLLLTELFCESTVKDVSELQLDVDMK